MVVDLEMHQSWVKNYGHYNWKFLMLITTKGVLTSNVKSFTTNSRESKDLPDTFWEEEVVSPVEGCAKA